MKVETQAELLLDFHSKVLVLRRIEHILQSEEFPAIFEESSREEKDRIIKHIYEFDFDGLKCYIKALYSKSKDLSIMSIRELRAKAQKLGVRNYNHLPKAVLLSAIAGIQKCMNCQNSTQKCVT